MGQAASYLKAGLFSKFPRLPALTFHTHCGLNSRVNWAVVLLWEPTYRMCTGLCPQQAWSRPDEWMRTCSPECAGLWSDTIWRITSPRGHGGSGMITSHQHDHVTAVPQLWFPKTTPFYALVWPQWRAGLRNHSRALSCSDGHNKASLSSCEQPKGTEKSVFSGQKLFYSHCLGAWDLHWGKEGNEMRN